jgi:hypothetical protein
MARVVSLGDGIAKQHARLPLLFPSSFPCASPLALTAHLVSVTRGETIRAMSSATSNTGNSFPKTLAFVV